MGLEVNANSTVYSGIRDTQFTGSSAAQAEATAAQLQQTQVVIESDTKNQSNERESNQTTAAQQIEAAIKSANRKARFGNTNAQFTYHEKTKRISIKIFDKETNELIKEIPPEETLEMISKMWELAGLLVDEKR